MLSDEQFAEIEDRAAERESTHEDVQSLMDTVDVLRERLATAETFIREVADTPGRLGCSFGCNINERWNEAYPERHGQHGPTCKVTMARAWLASGDGEGA